jgi:paraquat-inducible protein B
MKTKVSPAMIGVFVLGAAALGLIALLSFGSLHLFSKPQRFVIYFNETIQGLDLGSPVKMRGVRIGRVVDLNIRYDEAHHASEVEVVCELSQNLITDSKGGPVNVTDQHVLKDMVDRGLRARLGVLGLATGMLYVELDFHDPDEYPALHRDSNPAYLLVPAIPSAISEYQASLSEILSGLKKVDFEGLSKDARALLGDARRQINKLEVKDLLAEWTRTAQSFRSLAESPELKLAIVHFDGATQELRGVLAKIDARIDPTGQKLDDTLIETRQALESFNKTAGALRQFITENKHLGDESSQALQRIGEAAESVQRLADYLERNPSALLTGRKK